MPRPTASLLRALVLVLVASGLGGCALKAKGSTPRVLASGREPREIYAHGEKMMRRGLHDKAMADFQELRNFHRDDPLSVRAQLALAEIHFEKSEFEEARYAYEEFLTYHPRHPDLDLVLYRIGLAIWKRAPRVAGRDQTLTRSAVNRWTGFSSRFPESEYKDEVDRLLGKGLNRLAAKELFVARFYGRRDAWEAVDGRTRTLLRRYPSTKHIDEALARLSIALHARGRTPEAREALERLTSDHPDSVWIARVDRELDKPAGELPEEITFPRPYRLPGMSQPQQPQR